jgi:hypothetical protein
VAAGHYAERSFRHRGGREHGVHHSRGRSRGKPPGEPSTRRALAAFVVAEAIQRLGVELRRLITQAADEEGKEQRPDDGQVTQGVTAIVGEATRKIGGPQGTHLHHTSHLW